MPRTRESKPIITVPAAVIDDTLVGEGGDGNNSNNGTHVGRERRGRGRGAGSGSGSGSGVGEGNEIAGITEIGLGDGGDNGNNNASVASGTGAGDGDDDDDDDDEDDFVDSSSTMTGGKKSGGAAKRAGFTNREKKALREWVQSQETKPSQKQCIDWFYQRFGRMISQSGVSRCLSKNNKHLDSETVNEQSIRNRYGKYPILENILVDWQQYQVKTGGPVSAALLLKKAREFWNRIPAYRDTTPEFNYRWLDRFRKRHNIEYTPGIGRGVVSTNRRSAATTTAPSTSSSAIGSKRGVKRAHSVLSGLAESTSSRPGLPLSASDSITDPALFSTTGASNDVDINIDDNLIDNVTDEGASSATAAAAAAAAAAHAVAAVQHTSTAASSSPNESVRAIQNLVSTYDPANVYTAIETGFYWRKSLSAINSLQSIIPRPPLSFGVGDNSAEDEANAAAVAAAAAVIAIQEQDISPEISAAQNITDKTAQDVARSVLAQQQKQQNTNLLSEVNSAAGGNNNSNTNSDAPQEKFTVILGANVIGSDRLPLWFIGSDNPPSLKIINLSGMNASWSSRRTPGLDVFTMRRWLSDFYEHISIGPNANSRRILLILEKTPIHEDAVKLVTTPINVRVEFLPERARTLGVLPLEQEVVQRWKVNYTQHWMKYIVESYRSENEQNDPVDTVKVLDAIQWAVQAWFHEMSDTVFRNAFLTSILSRNPIPSIASLEPVEDLPNLDMMYNEIKQSGRIPDIISLHEFLNSAYDIPDVVQDNEGDLLDAIVERHLGQHGDTDHRPIGSGIDLISGGAGTGARGTIIDEVEMEDTLPDDVPDTEQVSEYIDKLIHWAVRQRSLSKGEIFPLLAVQSFVNKKKEETLKRNEAIAAAASAVASSASNN